MPLISRERVTGIVFGILSEVFNVDIKDITNQSRLREDLGADSLNSLDAVMDIQEEFKIELPDDVLVGFSVVDDVIEYIIKQIEEDIFKR